MSDNPFDYVRSINQKDYMKVDESYNSFLVNRAFSYYVDTILYAADLNINKCDNKMHYDYLFYSIKKGKRFAKWHKAPDFDDLKLIQEYYNYSYQKAKETFYVLTEKQLEHIREKLKKE